MFKNNVVLNFIKFFININIVGLFFIKIIFKNKSLEVYVIFCMIDFVKV